MRPFSGNKRKRSDSADRKPFSKHRDSESSEFKPRREFSKSRYNSDSTNSTDRKPRFRSDSDSDNKSRSWDNSERKPRRSFNDNDDYRPKKKTYSDDSEKKPRYKSDRNNNEFKPRERSWDDKKPYKKRDSESGDFKPRRTFGGSDEKPYSRFHSDRKSHSQSRDFEKDTRKAFKPKPVYQESESKKNDDGSVRLNRFISNAGVCSRREADELILEGKVKINGKVITELGVKVLPSDTVTYKGKTLVPERKVYVLVNKPKDCVTTRDDPEARRTVFDLLKGSCYEQVHAVGRLDRNTTGVLLLTNDGELTQKLTHPKFNKSKIYQVWLDRNINDADLNQIQKGIELEDGFIKPDDVSFVDPSDRSQVGIEIHSGQNRVVRRIFEFFEYKVIKLDRVYFAGLTKKGLQRGEWRYLTNEEVSVLKRMSFK